jgi:hypothetical protein
VTITPPPDSASVGSGEVHSLKTLVSEEELETTIETLNLLAGYPGVLKSKAAKELRGAVYEFRQACSVGVNAECELFNGFP